MKQKKTNKNKYKSRFEEVFGSALGRLGISFEYEKKKIKYLKEHTYILDFELENSILIETKGYFKASDRTKHLDVKKQNPDLDIRFVFMADNRLHKLRKTKYSDWCIKHGFKYCISKEGFIPKEWLDEIKKSNVKRRTKEKIKRK